MLGTLRRIAIQLRLLLPFPARVCQVQDGDSLVVKPEGMLRKLTDQPIRVRLAGIDAPEYDQPGGREAHSRLSDLTRSSNVTLSMKDVDKYSRLVANLYCSQGWANLILVQEGLAHPTNALMSLVAVPARLRKKGIYGPNQSIHPRHFRALQTAR